MFFCLQSFVIYVKSIIKGFGLIKLFNISNDDEKIADFYQFYKNYFPPHERDTLESMLQLAHNSAKNTDWDYNIIEIADESSFIGGLVYDYFKDINVIVIEFIFIIEKFRSKSIVRQVFDYLEKKIPDVVILVEVDKDSPNIDFWRKKGFSIIQTDYIQPKISNNEKPFDGLVLMSNKPITNLQDVIQNHYWKYCFLYK